MLMKACIPQILFVCSCCLTFAVNSREMNFFVLFSLATILLIYVWLKRRCNYWTSRGFPSAELIFPFGSLKGIGTEKSLCTGLDEFYKQFKEKGPAVGLFYFVKPMLLPMDPALIKSILVTNFDCFQDRSIYYNKEDDPISAHLLALEGEFGDQKTSLRK